MALKRLRSVNRNDDVPDSWRTATRLPQGTNPRYQLSPAGDVDYFRVYLQRGRTYRFDLQSRATNMGTLDEAVLGLHATTGGLIRTDMGGGIGENCRITWYATTSGDHFLEVSALYYRTGRYHISATPIPNDDHSGEPYRSTYLPVDGSRTGNIDYDQDKDFFRVSLVRGRTYRFDLQGSDSGHGTLLTPDLVLYGSTGREIVAGSDNGRGRNDRIYFTAASTRSHYLKASAGALNKTGTYRVRARDITANCTTQRNTPATAAPLRVDMTVDGSIDHPADSDYYRVSMAGGQTYEFVLQAYAWGRYGTLRNPLFEVRRPDGSLIGQATRGSASRIPNIMITAPSAGTYYIRVASSDGETGSYGVSYIDIPTSMSYRDDYKNPLTEAAPLAVGNHVNGRVGHYGDRDCFRVRLTAGRTYRFDLNGRDRGGAAGLDRPQLDLYGPDRKRIDRVHAAARGRARITFTASATGYYVLRASGRTLASRGAYILRTSELIANNRSNSAPLGITS